MNTPDWKPPFQRWWESDFCGSYSVRKMPRLARLMYRCLLQSAWNTDNPPYLPNDDKELMELADAPSEGAWNEHKGVIRERFQRSEDGKWLYHRKTLAEFERAQSEHQRKGDAVKRRWKRQTQAPADSQGAATASEIARRQQAGEEWRR